VAVVGSGPAGLAAAQQLTRAGHRVVVFERAEAPGGLLRYGIPEFKLEKWVLDRRLAQMTAEGTRFRTGVWVGGAGPEDSSSGAVAPDAVGLSARRLLEEFDVVLAATGSTRPRDLPVPGRHLDGVHFAMEYLKASNLACETGGSPRLSASGKDVVIIGGGDTGADCLGTAHRQGARSVRQLEILPEPPSSRPPDNPWPTWPLVLRTTSAHEEGGERRFAVETTELLGGEDTRVRAVRLRQLEEAAGGELELPADLVLLALGFLGPERSGLVAELGLELTPAGTVAVDSAFSTSHPRVFCCGDMVRGQSLIVWAIAEGRAAAAFVDRHLTGRARLASPVSPFARALA
jgi:glutamate synthase (NADPH/NADH) small chain